MAFLGVGLVADSQKCCAKTAILSEINDPVINISVKKSASLDQCAPPYPQKVMRDLVNGRWFVRDGTWCHIDKDEIPTAWLERVSGDADKLIEVSSNFTLLLPPPFEIQSHRAAAGQFCKFSRRTKGVIDENLSLGLLSKMSSDCLAPSFFSSLGRISLLSFTFGPVGEIPVVKVSSKPKSKAVIYVVGGPFEGVVGDLNQRHFSRFLFNEATKKFDLYIPSIVGADKTILSGIGSAEIAIRELKYVVSNIVKSKQYEKICIVGGSFGGTYIDSIVRENKDIGYLAINPVIYNTEEFLNNIIGNMKYKNDSIRVNAVHNPSEFNHESQVESFVGNRVDLFRKFFEKSNLAFGKNEHIALDKYKIIISEKDVITGNIRLGSEISNLPMISVVSGATHSYETSRNFVLMEPLIQKWLSTC